MASGTIKIPKYQIKTFTVDCDSQITSSSIDYQGTYSLTDADIGDSVAIIPLFARKAGTGRICNLAVENHTIRLNSIGPQTGVNVGLLFVY